MELSRRGAPLTCLCLRAGPVTIFHASTADVGLSGKFDKCPGEEEAVIITWSDPRIPAFPVQICAFVRSSVNISHNRQTGNWRIGGIGIPLSLSGDPTSIFMRVSFSFRARTASHEIMSITKVICINSEPAAADIGHRTLGNGLRRPRDP